MDPSRSPADAALLRDLAERLRPLGMVVVPTRDYLEVRLGLLASVRVRVTNGQLQCEARVGAVSRERATWASLGGIAVITAYFILQYGVAPVPMVLGFVGLASIGGLSIRYQLTEACITRVQTAWMLMTSGRAAAPGSEAPPQLGEPAPDVGMPRRAAEGLQAEGVPRSAGGDGPRRS